MTHTPSCPELSRLHDLLKGTLPEADQAALHDHLETCERCPQTLQELVADRDTWVGAARKLGQAPPPEATLRRVMEQLKGEGARTAVQDDTPAPERPALDFLTPSDRPGYLGRFGRYEVLEVIGRGGMGVVLKALDSALNRFVAVKVLAPHLASHEAARKRFAREAQAAAAVGHDHLVTIHAVEEAGGLPYLVMQYVAGPSLQQLLDRGTPPDVKEIVRIGHQAARGLAAAHAQGLIHRDVKPANVLLEGDTGRVKITDFGLARAAGDGSLTQSGVIAGTPQYMAPEQARGEALDHRADLFSLGSVLYALCTGRPPFQADAALVVMKRVCDEPPPPIRGLNPAVPEWLDAVVMKLLAKGRADRFQSAAEVADLLGRQLAHLEQGTTPPPVLAFSQPPTIAFVRPKRRRSPAAGLAAAAAVLALVAGGLGLAGLLRNRTPAPEPVVNREPDADKKEPKKAEFPADLARLPADALGFVHLRLGDFDRGEAVKSLHQQMGPLFLTVLYNIESTLGLLPTAIETVTVAVLPPPGKGEAPAVVLLVTSRENYSPVAVQQKAAPDARPHFFGGKQYYLSKKPDKETALHFLTERTYLLGSERAVKQFLEQAGGKGQAEGPLSPAFRLAAEGHHVVAGWAPARVAALGILDRLPGEWKAFKPLLSAELATLQIDFDKETKPLLELTFADEAGAGRAREAAVGGLDLLRREVEAGLRHVRQGDYPSLFVGFLERIEASLRDTAAVDQDGRTVRATVTSDPATVLWLSATVVTLQELREAIAIKQCTQNLQAIGIALQTDDAPDGPTAQAVTALESARLMADPQPAPQRAPRVPEAAYYVPQPSVTGLVGQYAAGPQASCCKDPRAQSWAFSILPYLEQENVSFDPYGTLGMVDRALAAANLHRLGQALAAYQKAHGHLPPAWTRSKDGKPLLSWRVAVLPYLGDEEAKLYKEFKQDEPWDGPHNQKLLARMPKVFAAPNLASGGSAVKVYFCPEARPARGDPAGATVRAKRGDSKRYDAESATYGEVTRDLLRLADISDGTASTLMLGEKLVVDGSSSTAYQVFVGPGAAFEGGRGLGPKDFTDGAGNAILVVEAARPVPWTKPADLHYKPDRPVARPAAEFPALFADGTVRTIKKDVDEKALRALITRRGAKGPE